MSGTTARVPDGELLARFVFRDRVRADGTIRPDAWMPPLDLELSVTRHASLSEPEIWSRGRPVEAAAGRALFGRADISAANVRVHEFPQMDVVEWPLPENPEHAHVIGWPPAAEKPQQKMIATRLAAGSVFVGVTGESDG